MVQFAQTEDVVKDVIERAEQACQKAMQVTPAEYREFLAFLPRHKRAGGTRANPVYTTVLEPYMSVDGRVKMAMDDHRAAGATLSIQTSFEVEPHSGQLLCKAVVISVLLGSATAHARVFLGGSGVDATNPLENAETSAVGRALGFLGYGLYGSGIASVEEVIRAATAQEALPATSRAAATAAAASQAGENKPPSNRQRDFLKNLWERTGLSEGEITAQLASIASSREASETIKQLREQLRKQFA